MQFTSIILIHLTAALLAVAVGGMMLALKKGTRLHRMAGLSWVGLMLVTALLSFGIRSSGGLSWIHLLSLYTLFSITMAMVAIYRHDVPTHRRYMRGTYIGLVVAGVFTLLPQRRLGYLVWHGIGLV
jgi:uncharacterized membrane protein